jgi:hypothetical protein
MKRFATLFVVTLGLGTLVLMVSLFPQKNVNGAVAALVDVANTPLPVTGSVNAAVTGTVGLTGTALVRNADDPGRIAYESESLGTCTVFECDFYGFGSVPPGHRLVIQHISGDLYFFPNGVPQVFFYGAGPGFAQVNFFPPGVSFAGVPQSAFDQTVQVYFDAGQPINVRVTQQLSGGAFNPAYSSQQAVALTGYMLDCTASPCSTIAH